MELDDVIPNTSDGINAYLCKHSAAYWLDCISYEHNRINTPTCMGFNGMFLASCTLS